MHGYAQGLAIPDRLKILDGEPPANSEPVRVVIVPGTQYSYSNGGYIVVEQLLADAEGTPFDVIVQEIVLEPLHMDASTFKYQLPENLAPIAASGHRVDGASSLEDGTVIPKWVQGKRVGNSIRYGQVLYRFNVDLYRSIREHHFAGNGE